MYSGRFFQVRCIVRHVVYRCEKVGHHVFSCRSLLLSTIVLSDYINWKMIITIITSITLRVAKMYVPLISPTRLYIPSVWQFSGIIHANMIHISIPNAPVLKLFACNKRPYY